jgi:hypothetical protein
MAIPLAPALVALISIVGVGIFKVVEGDHDRALSFFLEKPGGSRAPELAEQAIYHWQSAAR